MTGSSCPERIAGNQNNYINGLNYVDYFKKFLYLEVLKYYCQKNRLDFGWPSSVRAIIKKAYVFWGGYIQFSANMARKARPDYPGAKDLRF
ncbi:MAG: hypothetical protein ACQEP5_10130 [Actinomycetota bacterium]